MATRSLDVVILGGGNAEMGVTVAAREAGLNVAMIEPDLLGGTCPIVAPYQKRCWSRRRMRSTRSSAPKRIISPSIKPSLDWAALIDREKAMIAGPFRARSRI